MAFKDFMNIRAEWKARHEEQEQKLGHATQYLTWLVKQMVSLKSVKISNWTIASFTGFGPRDWLDRHHTLSLKLQHHLFFPHHFQIPANTTREDRVSMIRQWERSAWQCFKLLMPALVESNVTKLELESIPTALLTGTMTGKMMRPYLFGDCQVVFSRLTRLRIGVNVWAPELPRSLNEESEFLDSRWDSKEHYIGMEVASLYALLWNCRENLKSLSLHFTWGGSVRKLYQILGGRGCSKLEFKKLKHLELSGIAIVPGQLKAFLKTHLPPRLTHLELVCVYFLHIQSGQMASEWERVFDEVITPTWIDEVFLEVGEVVDLNATSGGRRYNWNPELSPPVGWQLAPVPINRSASLTKRLVRKVASKGSILVETSGAIGDRVAVGNNHFDWGAVEHVL